MKKFLIFFMATVLNCQIALAENNLLNYGWWQTATIKDVQKEIANGTDVNAKNSDKKTVLMQAIHCGASPEIIKMLLDAGADVNIQNRYGATVLYSAVDSGRGLDVVKVLINADNPA